MSLDPSHIFALSANAGPRLVVLDSFMGREAALSTCKACRALDESGELRPAGMGRESTAWRSSALRGDRLMWLTSREPGSIPDSIVSCLESMKLLRDQLQAKAPWLNIGDRMSVQLACYPGAGEGYVRHVDTFGGGADHGSQPVTVKKSHRKITALYYLNPNWQEGDGGKLRAYYKSPEPQSSQDSKSNQALELQWDIEPKLDRLVLFRSDVVPHEVLPSNAIRYALTCWMYTRESPEGHDNMKSEPAGEAEKKLQTHDKSLNYSQPALLLPEKPQLKLTHRQEFQSWSIVSKDCDIPYPVCHGLRILDPEDRRFWVAKMREKAISGKGEIAPGYTAKPLPFSAKAGDGLNERSSESNHRIFVSIASYRDTECQHTLTSIFASARYPEAIRVGICFQYDHAKDSSCFDLAHPMVRPSQVRVMHVEAKDACGPCWARHFAEKLFDGDFDNKNSYVLQLDSHMRMRPGWDTYLIDCIHRCPSKKPVITAYPLGYELPNKVPLDDIDATVLCADKFDDDGMLRIKGKRISQPTSFSSLNDQESNRDPFPSLFWASGFSFARSSLLRECPYDPNLPHLFFGEEILMLARMWTRGWDMYSPSTAVAYHLWTRSYRPTVRENFEREGEVALRLRKQSQTRVRKILSGENPSYDIEGIDHDIFGLGDCRTLEEFQDYCGVNFKLHTILDRAKSGGQPRDVFRSNFGSAVGSTRVSSGSEVSSQSSSAAAQVFKLLQMKGLLG